MNIRFSGFGGQGIILSGVIFGYAAVLDGLNVIQTQSYGSSARGGTCKCDVMIDKKVINELEPDELDILVAFSQPAFNKFKCNLKRDGLLFADKDLVRVDSNDIRTISIPATDVAFKKWNNKIIGNIIMIGCIAGVTKIITEKSLEESVLKYVPEKYANNNILALKQGFSFAINEGVVLSSSIEV